jgi:hypothetical protein
LVIQSFERLLDSFREPRQRPLLLSGNHPHDATTILATATSSRQMCSSKRVVIGSDIYMKRLLSTALQAQSGAAPKDRQGRSCRHNKTSNHPCLLLLSLSQELKRSRDPGLLVLPTKAAHHQHNPIICISSKNLHIQTKSQRSLSCFNLHWELFLAGAAWHDRSFEQQMDGLREPPFRSCSFLQATFALHRQC